MVKSNKVKKTEELIAEYQEAECLWNVLSPSYKYKLSGKIFWKQPLTWVVEKGVLKI